MIKTNWGNDIPHVLDLDLNDSRVKVGPDKSHPFYIRYNSIAF